MKKTALAQSKHISLLQLFEKDFIKIYHHMIPSCKKDLLALVPTMFHKWYTTSLLQETVLTPANIISFDIQKKGEPQTVYAYTIAVNKNHTAAPKFSYRLLSYSLQHHPLLMDLQKLVEYCTPDISVDEDGFFFEEDKNNLLPLLSQQDTFYLEYLMLLAWELQLIQELPSLYINKIQSTPKGHTFFEGDTKKILLEAIDAGLSITADKFNLFMHMEEEFLTADTFRTYLSTGKDIDHIFIDLYSYVNVDIETVWNHSATQNVSKEESSILSSLFFLSIVLDKWFLTPFGTYFRIIQQLHCTPYRFVRTINNLANMLIVQSDVSMELFTPCTYYDLSPLGEALYADATEQKNMQVIPDSLTYTDIMAALSYNLNTQAIGEDITSSQTQHMIYTFKIKFAQDKRYWRTMEISSAISLAEMCRDISAAFSIDSAEDYTVIVKDKNNFPVIYRPAHSKKSVNKAEQTLLENLHLKEKDIITFIPSNDRNSSLMLELISISFSNPHVIYPRIIKQSKWIPQEDVPDDLF